MSKIIIEIDLADEDAKAQIQNGIDALKVFLGKAIPFVQPDAAGGHTESAKIKEVDKSDVVAPKPPAPAATTAAPPPPPAGVDLDSEGLPWDARIHTKSKMKLVKGNTWKLIRNLDPAVVAQVKAELKATMAAAPASTETSAADAFGETEAPELPETLMTFPELMNIITPRLADGSLAQTDLDTIVAGVGLPSLQMLASRPDLVPTVAAELEAV